MKLILMRHCKSSWSHPGVADHERPLNKRGYRSAEALGNWLRREAHLPELALVSSSRRTMETFEGLRMTCESRYLNTLYHAGPMAMLTVLQEAQADCILMIGHNPGTAEFAARLLRSAPHHSRFDDYPTGATLIAEFLGRPTLGTANARDFVIPRALLGEA